MKRQVFVRFAALLPIMAVMLVAAFSLIPTQSAEACLPCDCPDNTAVNCWGPYQLFTDSDEDGENCTIEVWLVAGDKGERAFRVTPREQSRLPLPEEMDENVVVEEVSGATLYWLMSGEYQLNVGPDGEGKVHTINWEGCPADDVVEGTFTVGQ